MTRTLGLFAAAALLFSPRIAVAQWYGPPGGVGFQYAGGRLRVAGAVLVVPTPYGAFERRIIIQQVLPAPVRAPAPEYDLSGIDLDVEPVERLFPPGAVPPPKRPEAVKKAAARAPLLLPAPAMSKSPSDPLQEPRAGAAEESRRLVELGRRAFRAGEYGLAAARFRQAADVDPAHARAWFLLAQAYLAVGQFRDATAAVEAGLRLDPDWPTRAFNPAAELYADAPEDWRVHRNRLDDAAARRPQELAYRFLRAYAAWCDGRRAQAAEWFRQARPLAADPHWIDLFLKHAPAAPLARRFPPEARP